jgi:hypothetical protein
MTETETIGDLCFLFSNTKTSIAMTAIVIMPTIAKVNNEESEDLAISDGEVEGGIQSAWVEV